MRDSNLCQHYDSHSNTKMKYMNYEIKPNTKHEKVKHDFRKKFKENMNFN